MKQEEKELLLKDLCARLPYDVKIHAKFIDTDTNTKVEKDGALSMIDNDEVVAFTCDDTNCYIYVAIHEVKPYLFPLSSMTEEQTEEVHSLIYQGVSESVDETKEWLKTRKENDLRPITLTYILSYKLVIDWLNKNHFDYRGLIEKGSAIDATGLNIY